jgi:hypothetical protein
MALEFSESSVRFISSDEELRAQSNVHRVVIELKKMLVHGGKNVEKMLHSSMGFVQILSLNVGTRWLMRSRWSLMTT